MAKDPAVLFYTSDFISGTLTMTDEQRGQYIMLLCLQHQKGYLTEKDMLNICKTYDQDVWDKFRKIGDRYYNERMKYETEKRRLYSESRSKNRKGSSKICNTYDKHMENENENVNKDNNNIPDFENFKKYAIEKQPLINLDALKFKYEAWKENGWKDGNDKKIVNWKTKLLNTMPHMKLNQKEVVPPSYKRLNHE